MRRIFLFFAVSIVSLVCSCSRDVEPLESHVITRITAYSGETGVSTRTQRDEQGTFYWSAHDQISLFFGYGDNGGSCFTSVNDERAQNADFTGTLNIISGSFEDDGGGKFWGVYPYNESTYCFGEGVVTDVPVKQYAAEGTFADRQFVSIACSPGLSLAFYHLCGGIKFFLENPGITRIVLKGNAGEELAGRVEVMMDEENHPYVSKFIEPSTSVTLYPPEGQDFFQTGVEYFIVTLPVVFNEGFNVSFYKETDNLVGERWFDVQMPIHRTKFQWSDRAFDSDVYFHFDENEDVEFCDIMDPGVRSFIETVDYSDDPDYTYSKVLDFEGSDQPQPVVIKWDGTASRVILSTSKDFEEDSIVQDISISESPAFVYNLVPGTQYFYRVISDYGGLIKESSVMPVGPLRMIHGVTLNMRDLGGWKSTYSIYDGYNERHYRIKYGKLYRGYNINDINEEGRDIIQNTLGVTFDMDLRGYHYPSLGTDQPVRVLDFDYINYPVVKFLGNGSGETSDLYREAIKTIISYLEGGNGNIFFHCIGGADRTGTLAFLIEALLGISESDLSKDYELTTYSGQTRLRTDTSSWPFKRMIEYMNNFSGDTINDRVLSWATTGDNALSYDEIGALRELLLEEDNGF